MSQGKLTENGIEKILGSISGCVLQALNVTKKVKNSNDFYSCELSDGYCKLKGCLIVDEEVFTKNKMIQDNLIMVITRFMVSQNRQKTKIVIIEHFDVKTDKVTFQIGAPLYYEQFIKNGKRNPKGSNTFQIHQKRNKYQDLIDDVKDEQQTVSHPVSVGNTNKSTNQQKPGIKGNNIKAPPSKGALRLSSEEPEKPRMSNPKENSNANPRVNNFKGNQNSNQISNNTSKPKMESPRPNNKNNKLKGPIEKVQRKQSPAVRGNQNRPHHQYNFIQDLYLGIILFVFPVKTFINKKGVDSCLMNMLVGDKTGTIECTMFGEMVQRFEGKFKEDQVFELANAVVGESNFMNNRYKKITINQSSRVSLKEDDPNVPFAQDHCITVKKLLDAPVGSENMVICLIKDTQRPEDFITKAGKEMRKKLIYLCDPEERVEVEVTIFGDKCDELFENQPFIFKGVSVGQYNGNRQYSLKTNSAFRTLKYHNYRKYIKDMENIQFANPDSTKKQQKHSSTTNLKDLVNAMDEVNEKGIWSQVVCSISTFKSIPKPIYMACPHCKKKVHCDSGQCNTCSKSYDSIVYKYMVNFSLCDQFESIWAMGFDQVSQDIIGISAEQYERMNEADIKDLVKQVHFKEVKVKLVTKSEVYNEEERKKTNVIKLMDLNYAEESKIILTRLEHLVGGDK